MIILTHTKMEEEIIQEEVQPLEGKHNNNMVMVCTLVINNIPIMYEWMSKEEADTKVRKIYRDEINALY